jgi:integrase/recombinase XerD
MAVKRSIKRSLAADDILLTDAFEEFIVTKEARNLSEATIYNYRYSFKKFIDFIGESTTGNAVESSTIYKWIAVMKQDGIKHISISSYLSDVRVFMYWCMNPDRAYIPKAFKIELLKGQEETLKLFTEEEQEALIEKPPRKASFVEFRTWAIVNWVLATGNRAATICSIQIQDLQFARREIVLERHTKNNKAQVIPMSSSLETVIKEYIRIWRKDADPTGYLFCNIGESQLTTNALRQSFAKYCHDRGVNKSNIHGLRHSFAKGWIKNNGNTFALQKMLGHSTLDMTRKYVNLFNEDIKEGFDSYNPLDNLKKGASRKKAVKRTE